MSTTTTTSTTRPPADRQAARATTWTAGLVSREGWHAGAVTVQAPDRVAAHAAALEAVGDPTTGPYVQGLTLEPMTRTEHATVRAFLAGQAVRLAADRSTGLVSRELRGGRVYVHQVMAPRCVSDVDPVTMAAAGAELDRWRTWGTTRRPSLYGRETTNLDPASVEPHAVRCAASKYPDAFSPTGRLAVLAWWSEGTAPTVPDTPAGRAVAARLARLHGGGRAVLELDGVTLATMTNAASAAHAGDGWDGPFRPILRTLSLEAAERIGPRAARLVVAVRSLAALAHPDHRPDVETAHVSADLDAAVDDPRDGRGGVLDRTPRLLEDPPSVLELHQSEGTAGDLDDVDRAHLAKLPARGQHDRVRSALRLALDDRSTAAWKLAAEHPAHFTTTPTTLDLEG